MPPPVFSKGGLTPRKDLLLKHQANGAYSRRCPHKHKAHNLPGFASLFFGFLEKVESCCKKSTHVTSDLFKELFVQSFEKRKRIALTPHSPSTLFDTPPNPPLGFSLMPLSPLRCQVLCSRIEILILGGEYGLEGLIAGFCSSQSTKPLNLTVLSPIILS